MLVVRRVAGLVTVQDHGRRGFASHGVPRGGALVPALARRANCALGNDEGAACLEIFGRFVGVAETAIEVATERADARALRAGEEVVVDPDSSLRVRYLALGGGVDAPLQLGSRSTLLVAEIGRPLRAGDRVASVARGGPHAAPRAAEAFDARERIRLLAGPDRPELGRVLADASWRVGAASDRTGTRLEGAPIAYEAVARIPSSPTVPGAVQLPPGGVPIVIGPDGPTTGGYPIVAVIARADLGAFHARPVGAAVRFALEDA